MSLITRLSVIFYVSIIWITSILLILFVVHVIELEVVMKYVALAYRDSEIGTAVIIIAGLFMIMSYLLARIMDGRRQMERTIAFDNPGGQ